MYQEILETGVKEVAVGLVLATKTYAKATPSPYCTTNELALLMGKKAVVPVKMQEGKLDTVFSQLVTEVTLWLEWPLSAGLCTHAGEATIVWSP